MEELRYIFSEYHYLTLASVAGFSCTSRSDHSLSIEITPVP